MTDVADKICRKNQHTHLTFSNCFIRTSCRLWDNVEKCGSAGQATVHNMIWRMRFACWITKATETHSKYVILIALPRQNSYANAPQCHIIRPLFLLLSLLWNVLTFSGILLFM